VEGAKEGDIAILPAEEGLKERGLAGLPRTGQDNGGELGCGPFEYGFQ